jgi:Domain of unknown function (DUF6487)
MTNKSIVCPKCNAAMEEGFILEKMEGGPPGADQWVEGAPEYSRWGNLKTKDHKRYQVTTYRCPGCGYLESYALQEQY